MSARVGTRSQRAGRPGAYVRLRGWVIRRLGRDREPAVRHADAWRLGRSAPPLSARAGAPAIQEPAPPPTRPGTERPGTQAEPQPEDEDLQVGNGWSAGSHWTTTAVRTAVWIAVLCGPVALIGVLVGGPSSEPVVQAVAPDADAGRRAATGEFAERFVTTWVATNSDNVGALNRFVELPDTMSWPTKAAGTATATSVSDIEQQPSGLWSVTVGADVTAAGEDNSQRRYFQVPVAYHDGGMFAAALPTPVPGPAKADQPETAYNSEATVDSAAGETIADFLTAMLAGKGDLTRYISPGAQLRPIEPAPYDSVQIEQIYADVDLMSDNSPNDGDEANILVTAKAAVGKQTYTPVEYALTLRSRDGRWEVGAVQATPQIESSESSVGSASGTSR